MQSHAQPLFNQTTQHEARIPRQRLRFGQQYIADVEYDFHLFYFEDLCIFINQLGTVSMPIQFPPNK